MDIFISLVILILLIIIFFGILLRREKQFRGQRTLLQAADILEHDGWIQHNFHDEWGRHCAAGAIGRVIDGDHSKAIYLLTDQLEEEGQDPNIISWNDSDGQTAHNVIQTMRKAARR